MITTALIFGSIIAYLFVGTLMTKPRIRHYLTLHDAQQCKSNICTSSSDYGRRSQTEFMRGYSLGKKHECSHTGKDLARTTPPKYSNAERCSMAQAKKGLIIWPMIMFDILRERMIYSQVDSVKGDRARLAELEAEKKDQAARVADILADLRVTDDEKIKRAFAMAGIE